jgi:hypothetical protein
MEVKLMNLNKKQKITILIIFIILIIAILVSLLIIYFKNKASGKNDVLEVSSNNYSLNAKIPDVTEENTKLLLSTLEEAEEVTISLGEKLESFNLYYFIYSSDPDKNVNNEEENLDIEQDIANTIDFSNYNLFTDEIKITEISTIYFIYEKDGEFSSTPYKLEINNIIKVLQDENSLEDIEEKQVDTTDKSNNTSKYYIKVNYGANTVTVYQKDENGDYTIPVRAMVCSCGTATPHSGVYKTTRGYLWGSLIGGVYGKYSTRIVGSILFHSVPYTSPSSDCLEYWEFDKLGQTASAGCIRLQVVDSKWIYDNCGSGTMVEFYSDSNPGPLGKPSAPKISDNVECRNWDPTDVDAGNPWHSFVSQAQQEEAQSEQSSQNDLENQKAQNGNAANSTQGNQNSSIGKDNSNNIQENQSSNDSNSSSNERKSKC